MVCEVPLNRGLFALVDDEDFERRRAEDRAFAAAPASGLRVVPHQGGLADV